MRLNLSFLILAAVAPIHVLSQQIWDAFQTTLDQSKAFAPSAPSEAINFVNSALPAVYGAVDQSSSTIDVDDSTKFQEISGFGATLTDSSASVLNGLKKTNSGSYRSVIQTMFSTSASSAGLNYIRVSIGASDFSSEVYSLADTPNSVDVDMSKVPAEVISVLKDIKEVNAFLRVHLVAWSPPAWMKTSGSMKGGSLKPEYMITYPKYLLNAVQGFISTGIPIHAISIQNEPLHDNPTYPSCFMSADVEAQLGTTLRNLLDASGLAGVKLVGYEHNWDQASGYPTQLMQAAPNAFVGAAFHCYGGTIADQDIFQSANPNKEIYFTECTGMLGADWSSGITWSTSNLWIGALEHGSKTGLMWNMALDYTGAPKLPGASSCAPPGCRGLVNIAPDGSYSFNPEFYSMAHASKAIIPQDANGPFGRRIAVTVTGGGLRVGAYETRRVSASEWNRYSIVVLNANAKATTTTIAFRGTKASYTFPVGVTTLWWYAVAQ